MKKIDPDGFGRIEGERLVSCILRWEPVFRGERRKWILDRAKFMEFRTKIRKEDKKMKDSKGLLKMIVLALLVGLGVVISPILRVEGMCPMAHFINVVCAVFLGPWYALLCAVVIGVLRMMLMGIPPLALTGAVFGAFLSGVFYRLSKGKIIAAVAGEVVGTGIIGALVSYPVMTILWGKEGLSWMFYVPSFICGTLIGGSIAFVFLRKLADNGMLVRFQEMLGEKSYADKGSVFSNACMIAAVGAIGFVVIKIGADVFTLTSPVWSGAAYTVLIVFPVAAAVYLAAGKIKAAKKEEKRRKSA